MSALDLLDFDTPITYSEKEIARRAKALPSYFGGKRKLFAQILEYIPPQSIVVDPMGGAMNIPFACKLAGHTIHTNDRSFGSYVIAKALIENNEHKIDINELTDLIQPTEESFLADNYGDVHLPLELMQYMDNIRCHVDVMIAEHQWVYLFLIYKYLTKMAPFGVFRYPDLVRSFREGTHPDSNQKRIDIWKKNINDPLPELRKIAQEINRAVTPGNGYAYNQELFDYLQTAEGNVIYLDPPYAGATVTYEYNYKNINKMMKRDISEEHETSSFNSFATERNSLMRMFELSKGFDKIIFSYWKAHHPESWFDEIYDECELSVERVDIGDYYYSQGTTSDGTKGSHEILHILS